MIFVFFPYIFFSRRSPCLKDQLIVLSLALEILLIQVTQHPADISGHCCCDFAFSSVFDLTFTKNWGRLPGHRLHTEPVPEAFEDSSLLVPGARFSKVPIINGPGKLSPFTLKIEVSIVLHLT